MSTEFSLILRHISYALCDCGPGCGRGCFTRFFCIKRVQYFIMWLHINWEMFFEESKNIYGTQRKINIDINISSKYRLQYIIGIYEILHYI